MGEFEIFLLGSQTQTKNWHFPFILDIKKLGNKTFYPETRKNKVLKHSIMAEGTVWFEQLILK